MVEAPNYTTRAMLVGAMVGGTASVANQLKAHQAGTVTPNDAMKKVAVDTIKASAISGVTSYAAGKMAKQPVLSLATILAVSAVSAYALSAQLDNSDKKESI